MEKLYFYIAFKPKKRYNNYMNKLSVKDSSLAFMFGSLLCQVSVGVFFVLAIAFCKAFGISVNTEWFTNNCWGNLLCSTILNLTLFLFFLIFKHKKDINIIQKPRIKKILLYSLLALVSFFVLYPAINLFEILLTNIGVKQPAPPILNNTTDFVVSIFSLAILPAIFEELLFRGIVLAGLKNKGKTFAILISATMFSLFHFSIHQTIYPFVMGILFAGIMFKENNILYSIIVHFICNILSLIHSYFNLWFVSTHWLYICIAILLFIAFLTFILIYAIKNNKNEETEKLKKEDNIFLFSSLGIIGTLWIIINIINFL